MIEIGPELAKLLTPLMAAAAAALGAWAATRSTKKEFKPNGGTSMRDAVDRIEDASSSHLDELAELKERLAALEAQGDRQA